MKTIGFIGLGLIGGSIAKTIRKFHPDYHILAYAKHKETLAAALNCMRSMLYWKKRMSDTIPAIISFSVHR